MTYLRLFMTTAKVLKIKNSYQHSNLNPYRNSMREDMSMLSKVRHMN